MALLRCLLALCSQPFAGALSGPMADIMGGTLMPKLLHGIMKTMIEETVQKVNPPVAQGVVPILGQVCLCTM